MAWTRSSGAMLVLVGLLFHRSASFNLDVDKPLVYSGPEGSYFGFSVDFFKSSTGQRYESNVLIGAPRANASSSASIVERGAVYSCPWRSASGCQQLVFDDKGTKTNVSCQRWRRTIFERMIACAPLYQWSTYSVSEREPVGTCYLMKDNKVVEYSPCRSTANSPEGQGFCQAGFSADFLKVRDLCQLIADDLSEIFDRFDAKLVTPFSNRLTTKSASAQYDDSYLGKHTSSSCVLGLHQFTKRMAAYFGHSVAASDLNNDGLVDLLVGAPLFMDRGSDVKLREVGQVSVYMGRGGFSFHPPQMLIGSEFYARFGSAIAALGDLDMDGYNDVAISAPYGGPDHNGLIYIHNGRPEGPDPSSSQVLQGRWASSYMPASFGYSMSGNTDIDQNGYPDLIVGVFGADKAVLYRARPVISVNATLDITPQIINPEEKNCILPGTSTSVSCFKVKYCVKASCPGARKDLNFQVDLMLDRLKQKEAMKRVLFLHSKTFQYSRNLTVTNGGTPGCEEQHVYLIDDREFRDKITPISVAMEYKLDYQKAADITGLLPIIDMSAPSNVTKQAHILLDCGNDNICKPDLRLKVKSDREQIYIGDDNALTLEISAENQGEGAYEAELHVYPPPQADFTGAVRSPTLTWLSCAYKKENQTKLVVCDLGNPMKGGTKVLAELRFSVHQLSEEDTSVKFDLQIVSSNQFESTSPRVSSVTKLAVLAKVSIRGTSSPGQILLPIANWKPKDPPVVGDDIGPQIVHVYELQNSGPSTISKAALDVDWPYHYRNGSLLYITSYETEGPINCTTKMEINPLNVSVKSEGINRNHVHKRDLESRDSQNDFQILCLQLKCQVGRLERRKNAILFIYSRLAVDNFLTPENQNQSYVVRSTASFSVIEMPYKNLVSELPSNSTTPVQFIIETCQETKKSPEKPCPNKLQHILLKLGFFKRVRPPQEDCTEKEQLQPEENGNTDA
uniref:Integrin alpha-2 domain-containing protein n=1 Tax=Gouania willdenowi TaxID=441366 RepID=A0A8C5H7V6_GOUWI